MGNDSPDWTTTVTTPAIALGAAFSVPQNTTVTVYDGALPAGTHSVKAFIWSAAAAENAASVQFIDRASGHTIETFTAPTGTVLIVQMDDVCNAGVTVKVTAPTLAATHGQIVAYLSDQAVWIDNDPSSPIPVTGSRSDAAVTAVEPGGVPYTNLSAANAPVSVTITQPAGKVVVIHAITASFSGATAGAPNVTVNLTIGGVAWEVVLRDGGTTSAPGHWAFPNGGMVLPVTSGTVTVTLTAAGAGGVVGCLSVVAEQRSSS